jgi:hypothetical protein
LQSTTLEAAKFNARLINRASDLIEEEKLDETQAGLITLAANRKILLLGLYTYLLRRLILNMKQLYSYNSVGHLSV